MTVLRSPRRPDLLDQVRHDGHDQADPHTVDNDGHKNEDDG